MKDWTLFCDERGVISKVKLYIGLREVSFFTRIGGLSICDELSPILSGPPL